MSVATNPEVQEAPAEAHSHADRHDGGGTEADAPLVMLSDKAAEKVKEIRGEENIEESYALRLKVQGGGCSGFSYDLYFDQPQETDRPFEVKGVKLICDEMSLMYLLGTEIDYEVGKLAAKFTFRNPNETDACGCGESVTIEPAKAD